MKFSYKDLTARFASLLGGQEEVKEEAKPAVETNEATPQSDEGFQAFASAVTQAIETLATQMSKFEVVAKENETFKTSLANVQSEVEKLKKMPAVEETVVAGIVEQKNETSKIQLSSSEMAQIEIMQYVRDAKALRGK